MRNALNEWDGGILIGGEQINNLRYVDDTTIFVATQVEMATLLNRIEQESEKLGLTTNIDKTKLMIVDKSNQIVKSDLLNGIER